MKGMLIHSESPSSVKKLIENMQHPGGCAGHLQPSSAEGKQIVYCSFFCPGYEKAYSPEGIIFETEQKPVYVCPVDNFEFMRSATYLPDYERFFFKSIDEMLAKYPTCLDFKRDFQQWFGTLDFAKLGPEIYSGYPTKDAINKLTRDYCLESSWMFVNCNEVAFEGPLKFRSIRAYQSEDELRELLASL